VVRAAKRWKASVKKHFDFLTDYGFRFDHMEDKWWATTAVYLSAALGVEVTRSVEFDRVEISLLRLVEGQAPEVEVWVTDRPLNRVLFDNVLEARGSDLFGQIPTGLSQRVVEEQLRLYAELLRTLVGDFLKGSDAALLEGERVIRERVSTNPQEVTIWLPATPRKPTKGGASGGRACQPAKGSNRRPTLRSLAASYFAVPVKTEAGKKGCRGRDSNPHAPAAQG
jgi:hypothetical protein